jgi:hypothetical protein
MRPSRPRTTRNGQDFLAAWITGISNLQPSIRFVSYVVLLGYFKARSSANRPICESQVAIHDSETQPPMDFRVDPLVYGAANRRASGAKVYADHGMCH